MTLNRRRLTLTGISLFAASLVVACSTDTGPAPTPVGVLNVVPSQRSRPASIAFVPGGSSQLWILQGPGLEAQAMATDPEGISFFSNPARTVMYPVKANVPAPTAWNVILWQKYTSFAAFQSAIAANTVPPGTKVVGYDDEFWSATPANEQADPIDYTIAFAKLAHQYGYSVISMPAENLMQKLYPGKDKFASFISYGMAAAVAPYVDYYHVQAQDLEITAPAYAAFSQTIASQVLSANPFVTVTAGVSTNITNAPQQVTSANIDAAIAASSGMVSGYWLNIVGATTPIASAALANL